MAKPTPKRTYPGVDRITDDPVRISIRGLWDRVYTAEALLKELQSSQLTAAQVQSLISAALSPITSSLSDLTDTIAGSGGGETCEPLTTGDSTTPEFIFAGGDIIMACMS
jgi:hypothetical protein